MDHDYLSKRRLGTTLLPWQQKFCDNPMYFMLAIHVQNFNQILYQVRNRSFKFSQNWLSNHMTSQILLDAQVFCPTNNADLAILNFYNCGTRRDIEKR